MFRTRCTICQAEFPCSEGEEGRTVVCPRCKGEFVARPLPAHEHFEPPRRNGEGMAILSFLLGLGAVTTFVCGIGAIFGLLGLLLGFGGLQSRFRGLSIVGLVFSLTGLLFSLGIVAIWVVLQTVTDREMPPHPNGTKAPFVDQ